MVTESCWPVGRSATRSRIGSGRVSWRRRLCARLGEMPRSAQTARTRSSSGRPARACQQSANCCCWSSRLSSSRWLAWAWMRLISSGVGSWSSSSTISVRTGARPSNPSVPASSWLALAASRRRCPSYRSTVGWSGVGWWPMHGMSCPVRISSAASAWMLSWEMCLRGLGASSRSPSAIRSIVPSTGALATVVTSNRAGEGSNAGLGLGMRWCPFTRRVLQVARARGRAARRWCRRRCGRVPGRGR